MIRRHNPKALIKLSITSWFFSKEFLGLLKTLPRLKVCKSMLNWVIGYAHRQNSRSSNSREANSTAPAAADEGLDDADHILVAAGGRGGVRGGKGNVQGGNGSPFCRGLERARNIAFRRFGHA
jgi:hypothetical protein